MYPVMSVLRRLAAHSVYATQEMLESVDGSLHVRLESATSSLSLELGAWKGASNLVAVQELVATADSSVQVAITLTEKENHLADTCKASDMLYTLVYGPETEEVVDGKVVRRARLAVIRGVYRASGRILATTVAKNLITQRFAEPPKGTIRL